MTQENSTSAARRWVHFLILTSCVACVPVSVALSLLALVAGPLHTTETCQRELGEPMVRFDEDLFPLIRKTCIGQTRQVQVVSPTVALPAVATLAMAVGGVVYLWQVGRSQRRR